MPTLDLIVTRHQGLVEWLCGNFPELSGVPVMADAGPADVEGKVVLGDLPVSVAARARFVIVPKVPGGLHEGLTAEALEELRARLEPPLSVGKARLYELEEGHLSPSYSLIVTKHQGLVEWLCRRIPELSAAPVLARATPEDVMGKIIVGDVPLSVAMCAHTVVVPTLETGESPRWDLTADELEKLVVKLIPYGIGFHRDFNWI